MAVEPAKATTKRAVILPVLVVIALLALMFGSYAWVSWKPVQMGAIVGPLVGNLFFWFVAIPRITKKSRVVPDAVPEPIHSVLKEDLRAVGVKHPQVLYAVSGPSAEFPRPLVVGASVSVSTRVLQVYSPEALRWSVKTDALASRRFCFIAGPLLFLCAWGSLLGFGLCERLNAPNLYYAGPVLLIVLGFVSACVLGFRFQVLTDREFTKTETDRRAAKEALGYCYFAQSDRTPGNRWLFFRRELYGRARRLGIELERGYRASSAGWDEVSFLPEGERSNLRGASGQAYEPQRLDA